MGTSARADARCETLLDDLGLRRSPEPAEALVEAVQAPDVVGVLAGAAKRAVEAEVGAVDRFRLLDLALLEQQRAERVARRLHPAPRLVVGQGVVQLDRPAQVVEGLRRWLPFRYSISPFSISAATARMSRQVLLNT